MATVMVKSITERTFSLHPYQIRECILVQVGEFHGAARQANIVHTHCVIAGVFGVDCVSKSLLGLSASFRGNKTKWRFRLRQYTDTEEGRWRYQSKLAEVNEDERYFHERH